MHSNYFLYTNDAPINANVSIVNAKHEIASSVTHHIATIPANANVIRPHHSATNSSSHSMQQPNIHMCQICCQIFQKSSSLKKHMRIHQVSSRDSDNSPYKCNACKIDYLNAVTFEEHIKSEHGQPQALKCVDCGCFRAVELTALQPFRCAGCAQRKSETYDSSITSSQNATQSQPVHVNQIKSTKVDMDALVQNMRSPSESNGRRRKLHQCSECDKCYKHQSTLAMHKKIHTGEFKYKCQYCQKEFYLAEYYNRHMRVHTKEKPYQCEVCDKSFSQSNTLIQHKRIHTGEKPYVCTICSKAFSVRDYLLKHIRVHTGEKPFECEICGKKYSQRSGLKSHQKSHYPDQHLLNGSQSQSQHLNLI
ncbi:zinc finger protein 879-like [Contarinia nasturtii]|uniref:zinc finger protein 879-like n=1 Tax=Contarinia nasturtii TaxID=265458 RepID=UPI0012D41E93|nr:zinc finger protein 879-like [Contarinia nasturtii]